MLRARSEALHISIACCVCKLWGACRMVSGSNQPAAAKRQLRDQSTLWSQYVPCDCDPEKGCSNNCPCAKDHNFCEKHCKCGGNCRNAHAGCSCKTSCTKQSCPCKAQERECDPARCLGCSATALGTVEAGGVVCQNMNILLGVTRRLAVGLSEVAGWGCFVMEDVKEGEYIVRGCLALCTSSVLCCCCTAVHVLVPE